MLPASLVLLERHILPRRCDLLEGLPGLNRGAMTPGIVRCRKNKKISANQTFPPFLFPLRTVQALIFGAFVFKCGQEPFPEVNQKTFTCNVSKNERMLDLVLQRFFPKSETL